RLVTLANVMDVPHSMPANSFRPGLEGSRIGDRRQSRATVRLRTPAIRPATAAKTSDAGRASRPLPSLSPRRGGRRRRGRAAAEDHARRVAVEILDREVDGVERLARVGDQDV